MRQQLKVETVLLRVGYASREVTQQLFHFQVRFLQAIHFTRKRSCGPRNSTFKFRMVLGVCVIELVRLTLI